MSVEAGLRTLRSTKSSIHSALIKKGKSTAGLSFREWPQIVGEIESSGAFLQPKAIVPSNTDLEVTADDGFAALLRVIIEKDTNHEPQNIAEGITIFGVTGTRKVRAEAGFPSGLPVTEEEMDNAFSEADPDADMATVDKMVLISNDGNITIGYLYADFTVTGYDPSTTDFRAVGWRRVSYHTTGDKAGTITVDNFIKVSSTGWNYLKNVRSCTREKLYYGDIEIWPNYAYGDVAYIHRETEQDLTIFKDDGSLSFDFSTNTFQMDVKEV